MGKLYWCANCEEGNIHDKQRHHYEKHLKMPYSETFFKHVRDHRNITKIKCLLCGYIVESDVSNRRMKTHAKKFHRGTNRLKDLFDPASALKCIAHKCSTCTRFIEEGRLNKYPKCPHGSRYDDPNDSSPAKTENGWPNEIRKRNAEMDISEREFKIFKENVGTEATSTTVEREPSDVLLTKCNICYAMINKSIMEKHMNHKHPEEAIVLERTATSTTVERDSTDEGFTKCDICHDRIETRAMEKHMRRKHLEKAIVLDSDSEPDEKPKIKVEKDAGNSIIAIMDSNSKPKIKVEKNAVHNTVTIPTPIPKEIPSNESNERPNQEPSDSETEFYPLQISKSELERFLLAERIYPKNGNFYLKDS